jgi:hypothetical protein
LESTSANNPSKQDATGDIIAYRDRTKHHPKHYCLPKGKGDGDPVSTLVKNPKCDDPGCIEPMK